MKNITSRRSSLLAAAAFSVFSAAATASEGYVQKSETIRGSYSKSIGSSFAGGSLSVYGRSGGESARIYELNRSLIDTGSYAQARVVGRLFGYSKTLGEVRSRAYLKNGFWTSSGSSVTSFSTVARRSNGFEVRLGGYLVVDVEDRFDSALIDYEAKPSVFEKSHRFWIGPIPVKVTAKAGVGVNLAIRTDGQRSSQLTLSVPRLDLLGSTRAWSYGSASISADAFVISAGVEGMVALANTLVTGTQGFRANSGAFGRIDLELNPLSTTLKACVRYPDSLWSTKKSCTTLWSWSSPSWTRAVKFY